MCALYTTWQFAHLKSDISFLDFVISGLFMKSFKKINIVVYTVMSDTFLLYFWCIQKCTEIFCITLRKLFLSLAICNFWVFL